MKLGRRPSFVLIAVGATVAACHIFLDPDDLTAGVGGDGSTSSGTISDGGVTDGTAQPPAWIGQVPSCAPKVPPGAELFAVPGGDPGKVPACPAGYEATGQIGYTGVADSPFDCTTGTCACGKFDKALAELSCTQMRLTYYADPNCTASLDAGDPLPPNPVQAPQGCTSVRGDYVVPRAVSAKVIGTPTISGSTTDSGCPASGTPGITKQLPRPSLEVHLCRATTPPVNPGCIGSDVPAIATQAAVACYQSTARNCEPGWDIEAAFATSADLEDTRTCRCHCKVPPDGGTCTGNVRPFAEEVSQRCRNGMEPIGATCRPLRDYGPLTYLENAAADLGSFCAADTRKEGSVSYAAQRLFLCCISRCQACRQSVIDPGAVCAPSIKNCLDDASCKTYFECAQSKRCATGKDGPCDGCGDPAPRTAALYAAVRACQVGACPAPECQ